MMFKHFLAVVFSLCACVLCNWCLCSDICIDSVTFPVDFTPFEGLYALFSCQKCVWKG